jgi:hypothetical protein
LLKSNSTASISSEVAAFEVSLSALFLKRQQAFTNPPIYNSRKKLLYILTILFSWFSYTKVGGYKEILTP